ncbi:MAG TPA: tetratricopeptide repeat protein [Rheinheimera sp.]|uniref:tetratricopeptide repeat protein n=1 Tax=Rheinheimera sp. TaxID=1869214 RepID=UPI002F93384B
MVIILRALLMAVSVASVLTACTVKPSAPAPVEVTVPYSAAMAKAVAEVPSLDDIFSLTPEQQAEFLQYFNSAQLQDMPRHKRLYSFLEQHTAGFNYLGQNYTAREAYANKSGNCISLAVLTKALADIAGIPIEFQTIISAPVYSMKNDYMLSSDHVRTFLYDPDFVPEKGVIYFGKPRVVVDYLPSSGDLTGPRISEKTFIAMFYRNLAADAAVATKYSQSLALLKEALEYDSHYSSVINLVAVVHRRLQRPELAEQFYQYGLDVAANKATLIGNYAMLKFGAGEAEQAEAMLQSLLELEEYDPYLWFLLGQTATSKQRYEDAVSYFSKAAEQAPYVHQLQLELAAALYRNQQFDKAGEVLAAAAALAPTESTRQRYDAKLQALKLYQSRH